MQVAANNGPKRGQVELVGRWTRPQPNPDRVEAREARHTHSFTGIDGRCMDCDARPTHVAAEYPCGTKVPRYVHVVYKAAG